jgi:hypothetical protein
MTNIKNKITSSYWEKCFPINFKEKIYANNETCSVQLIKDILFSFNNTKLTTIDLKRELYEEYINFLKNNEEQVMDILVLEGKKRLTDMFNQKIINFESFIINDNYFLTTLDFWLLISKYKIPTIFISSTTLLQSNHYHRFSIGYGNEKDKFVFIQIPPFKQNQLPSYKLILDNNDNMFISFESLRGECKTSISREIDNISNVENYIKNFSKPKKRNIIIEDDNDTDESIPKQPVKSTNLNKQSSIQIIDEFENPKAKKRVQLKGRNKTLKRELLIEDD